MADRKPTIPVVVEDEQEKEIIANAARAAGYDNPGAYIRALLQRDGVVIKQQVRGGWRGADRTEIEQPVLARQTDIRNGGSTVLCIDIGNTLEHTT